MELGLDKEKIEQYKALALKHLSNPRKLRLLVISVLVLATVAGVHVPFTHWIGRNRALAAEKKRCLGTIRDVEALRQEVDSYRGRLPAGADTNDWVQYVLAGLRQVRLRLRDMSSKPPQTVGPYRTVTLSIDVEGTYPEMKRFVEWLEQSDRLLRVDSVRLAKQSNGLLMRLVLLGVVRKNAKPA